MPVRERLVENLVLAEEAGQSRHASNRQRTDEKGPVDDRQVLLEPPHPPEILLTSKRVNDGTRPEKQERLEERVREEVENAGAEGAHAHRQEHVSQLRHRRIRQHSFDVVLHEGNRGCHEGGRSAHERHDRKRIGCVTEQHGVAPDHVHPSGDHRRGVDERRHRRRPLHGIRQPDVQWNLRGLSGGAHEQQRCRN